MSALNGSWRLVATDPIDDMQKKIGTGAEWVEKSIALVQLDEKLAPVEKIAVEGDKVTLGIYISGVTIKEGTLTCGVETDDVALDQRPIKLLMTKNSESKTTRVEKGEGYELTYVREAVGDDMTLTITGPDGINVVRKYKKI